MKFTEPAAFEIPAEWIEAAGLRGFVPGYETYRVVPDPEWPNLIIPFERIETPVRATGVQWFDRERMISILRGIAAGASLPPIRVHELPNPTPRPYGLRDGFHRFYASAAAGFKAVPATNLPHFDITKA